jgi:GNAT superfamily N-acetyltransferase
MTAIIEAVMPGHRDIVRDLFAEYLRWVCPRIRQEYRAVFDPESMIIHDMDTIDIFLPPKGFLLLGFDEGAPAGCACTRTLGHETAELKRMFVQPGHRRKGIGAALVRASLRRAAEMGFSEMRLDSAGFMSDAHRMYRSLGFADIPPYEESEIPAEHRKHWVFMSAKLDPARSQAI